MHWHHRLQSIHPRTVDLAQEERARRAKAHQLADVWPCFETLELWMEALGYLDSDIFAVTAAAYEAVTNALRHGNQGDLSKFIDFRFLVTRDEVVVEVEDQGPGFDPDLVPDLCALENLDWPLGHGLSRMRAYMTWVRFNPTGNRVTLGKQRSRS